MNRKLAFLVIPVLAACSSARPGVAPMDLATSEYQNWTCNELSDEQMRLSVATTMGSSETNAVRLSDQRRGYDAITQEMNRKACGGPKPIIAGIS
jgi:hypothetical protein